MDLETKIKWVTEAEDSTADSRQDAERCRDYNDNKQWTESEVATQTKRGQSAIVINRIKPKNDGLLGMEVTTRTACKAFPRTPKEDHDADSATEAIRFVCSDNSYNTLRSAAFENIIIEGTGGVEVIVVKSAMGKPKIKINHIFWDRILYDVHSRRKDFSDARWLGQVIWMDYEEARDKYPGKEDILEAITGDRTNTYADAPRWSQTTRRRVKIVEMYYRENGKMYFCTFTRSGDLVEPMESPYVNEEGEQEWPYCFASSNVGRNGDRYSPTKQLLGPQDEINKRRSKALHLNSVRQVRLEKGAVDDVAKVKRELARPDGVIETTPGMEFEILKTGDMAAAQFNLLAEAKMEIDAVGFSAAVSGKLQGDQSGVALRNRQAAGQTELAPLFDVLKQMDLRVYRKVWNCIRKYWTDEMWVRVTDDDQTIKFVGLNTKVTKGQMMLRAAKAQGATDADLQQLQMQIMQDPAAMQVVKLENNVAELDVDLQLADAPDVPTVTVEEFQGLAEVIKSGAPPVLMEAMIMASSIPHKERVLKTLRGESEIPQQVKEQMQQLQEQGQQLQQENQQLKSGAQEEMAKLKMNQEIEQVKISGNQQIEQMKLETERQIAAAKVALERDIAEAKLQIERDKVNAELELKAQSNGQSMKLERQKSVAKFMLDKELGSKKIKAEAEPNEQEDFDMANETMKAEQDQEKQQAEFMLQAMQGVLQATQEQTAALSSLASEIRSLAASVVTKDVKKKLKVIRKDGVMVGGEVSYQ